MLATSKDLLARPSRGRIVRKAVVRRAGIAVVDLSSAIVSPLLSFGFREFHFFNI